jgi:hypothetical protein
MVLFNAWCVLPIVVNLILCLFPAACVSSMRMAETLDHSIAFAVSPTHCNSGPHGGRKRPTTERRCSYSKAEYVQQQNSKDRRPVASSKVSRRDINHTRCEDDSYCTTPRLLSGHCGIFTRLPVVTSLRHFTGGVPICAASRLLSFTCTFLERKLCKFRQQHGLRQHIARPLRSGDFISQQGLRPSAHSEQRTLYMNEETPQDTVLIAQWCRCEQCRGKSAGYRAEDHESAYPAMGSCF